MWEVVFVLLLPTIAPGLALTRILDASADSFRKGLLCFPIGLLALFGTSGLLFVVQMWEYYQSRHSDSNLEFIFHLVLVTKGAKRTNKVYQMAKNGSCNPWGRSK